MVGEIVLKLGSHERKIMRNEDASLVDNTEAGDNNSRTIGADDKAI